MQQDLNTILKLTAGMGEALLRCGAEIARVEETMERVARHYGVTECQIYIIANGIFVNLCADGEHSASIGAIPASGADLSRLCDLNELSRQIEQEHLPLEEALRRFEKIQTARPQNPWVGLLASGVGAAAFCYLFAGDVLDCLGACILGCLVGAFALLQRKTTLSRALLHVAGSAMATGGAILLFRLGVVHHLDQTIIGSIIPMIPGVVFINGVRDIADGDYISGAIRLLDAILLFVCIAAGVYIALQLGGGQ